MAQFTFEQKEQMARDWLNRHVATSDHQLRLCDGGCHYLMWALFELDNIGWVRGVSRVQTAEDQHSTEQK